MKATTCDTPRGCSFPFYYSSKPTLIDGVSDLYLELAAPVAAYWALSLFFHILDFSGWKWLNRYRIHESAEVQTRNRVTRLEVVALVFVQQVLQTTLGLMMLSDDPGEKTAAHGTEIAAIQGLIYPLLRAIGRENQSALVGDVAWYIYWWAIPAAQFLFAMYVFCSFPFLFFPYFPLTHYHTSFARAGPSSTHGSTSCTGPCTSTNSCTGSSTRGTTGCMSPTLLVRCTTTRLRASSLTHSVHSSRIWRRG